MNQRVAVRGSYEVGLSFLEMQTGFFEVLNIFCIFCSYHTPKGCMHAQNILNTVCV
jgi:hypothetical protein